MARWDKPVSLPQPGGVGGGGFPQPVPVSGPVTEAPLYGSSSTGFGVYGTSNTGDGVRGGSSKGPGVDGESYDGPGVEGNSVRGNGVQGTSESPDGSGVWGGNTRGGYGVSGYTTSDYQADPKIARPAVFGLNHGTGPGVLGACDSGDGVWGVSWAKDHAAVSAVNYRSGFGVWASGKIAGHFEGDIEINGNINHNNGNINLNNGNLNIASSGDVVLADCAEPFDVADENADPGSVMVIDQDGKLRQCARPYDKTVAGVVSGAGNFRPGLVLGKRPSQTSERLIALLGKVYCKVDARHSPVEVGDLLTTSSTPGHAMKVVNSTKAVGCVIGKALRPLSHGQGLVPILIALQ